MITIPASIEAAKTALDGLGKLLHAKQWERAAIVYAFTEPNGGGSDTTPPLGIKAFARLDIVGLRTPPDVRAYRKAWIEAMKDGASDVKPGQSIELPTLPWKDYYGEDTADVQERVFKQVARDPERLKQIVHDSPEVADAIVEAVTEPRLRFRAEQALRDQRDREDAESRAGRTYVKGLRPTPPREVVERVIKAVDSFFATTITHNGQTLSYEDVIDEVARMGDVPELAAIGIVQHWLGADLRDALSRMGQTASGKVDRLQAASEAPAITAGDK